VTSQQYEARTGPIYGVMSALRPLRNRVNKAILRHQHANCGALATRNNQTLGVLYITHQPHRYGLCSRALRMTDVLAHIALNC
jgi:hypothetical protein